MKKKFIIIIPARKGSQRFPEKNHKRLEGKNLLNLKLKQCMHKKFGDVVVTSDDKKILESARKLGVKYIRERPENVAGDISTTNVVYDAVKFYEKVTKSDIDFFILSQLTSPFISQKDFKKTIEFFSNNKKFNSLIACKSDNFKRFFWFFFEDNSKNFFNISEKLQKQVEKFTNNKKAFIPNGGIYIIRRNKLKKTGKLYTGPVKVWPMSKPASLDIDYEEDLVLANYYIKKKLIMIK